MTVTFDWLEEDDGDNQESGGLDAYIDVDGSGVSFSGDQISSANFDGGIPKAQPTNVQVKDIIPGNYVFWNISTNTPLTVSIGAEVDGEDDGSESVYDSSLYLVLDIEYDDANDPDGTSTTATRYLYLQDEDESVKVSATGGTAVTIIGNSSPAEWDAGTNGWLLTSDGNAIFSNVLVRGTIDASIIQGSLFKTDEITDGPGVQAILNNSGLTFNAYNASEVLQGSAIRFSTTPGISTDIYGVKSDGTLTSYFIKIDPAAGDVGSGSDTGIFNIYNGQPTVNGSTRLTMDNNEMQSQIRASGVWNINNFSINPFGGMVTIGGGDIGGVKQTNTLKIWGTTTTPSTDGQSIQASGDIATTGDMYANQFRATGTGSAAEVIYGFQNDSGFNSGLYYISENRFGLSAGGNQLIDFRDTGTFFAYPVTFNNTTTFNGATNTFTDYVYFNSNTYHQATGVHRFNGVTYFNDVTISSDIYAADVSSSASERVVYVRGADGTYPYRLGTLSSTRRVKQQISNASNEILSSRFLELEPVKFKYNTAVSELGDEAAFYYGFIAEDAQELGLEFLYGTDEYGVADYFAHEKMPVYLFTIVKEQERKIKELENRLAILEG